MIKTTKREIEVIIYSDFNKIFNNDWSVFKDKATFNQDVGLTIEYSDDDEDRIFNEDWTKVFPNHTSTKTKFYIKYNNILIEEIMCVWVDGGRVILPIPKSSDILEVSKNKYNFSKRIHYIFNGSYDFDDYFNRAKLKVLE